MSLEQENQIDHLNNIIKEQSARINEQAATIEDLRALVAELRSLKANLEETIEEFRRQLFGAKSEKTTAKNQEKDKETIDEAENTSNIKVKEHTHKPKATRKDPLPSRSIGLSRVPKRW